MNELPARKDIDVSLEPIQFWYPILWKHKSPFHLYHIHDSFLKIFRKIFTREIPAPITKEARYFLNGKGLLRIEDNNTYFWLYGFEGMPFLFTNLVTDRLFVLEFYRQCLYWSSFFKKKHKRQFIQIPFSVADVHVKNIMHLKEVAREFKMHEFIEGPIVQ